MHSLENGAGHGEGATPCADVERGNFQVSASGHFDQTMRFPETVHRINILFTDMF
jgi:hypothetical protein